MTYFKEREKVVSTRRDSIQPQIEARNQIEMVGSHLSIQKVHFFKERERRGSISIQPDGSKITEEDGKLSS